MADVDPDLAALAAAVDAAEPDFVVLPDASSLHYFEAAHALINAIGVPELHSEHCTMPLSVIDSGELADFTEVAASAEALLAATQRWLREHGVPCLSVWYPSNLAGKFMTATLLGGDAS